MNIGIVLSGGMAKGAYQVGALKAISEFIPLDAVKYVSCASIGTLNGYAYATDQIDSAVKMWHGLCCEGEKTYISRVLKSDTVKNSIKSLYDRDSLPKAKFYTTLLDVSNYSLVYKNLTSVDPKLIPGYLAASVSMPMYNRAIRIDGVPYFDGAMVDNIPVHPLLKHRIDYLICVYFDDVSYRFETPYFDNKIIKVTFPTDSGLRESLVFTRQSIDKMLTVGYDHTRHILKGILYDGYEDVEAIYKAIELTGVGKPLKLRLTGDVIVTNLNKVTQKFAQRKIII